ncbi:MAG: hypothetical protein K2X86_17505 [Cytophagaceae bacterium]|nr:hypothetical protein [Cytophagaceae bacterium]
MRLFFSFFLLITSSCAFAQYGQQQFNQNSAYTYIYKIKYDQARAIYKRGYVGNPDKNYFNVLMDSFPSEKKIPSLPAGEYLLVSARENKSYIVSYSRSNLKAQLLYNHTDFFLLLFSRDGKIIRDAIVKLDSKVIPFDQASQSYLIKNYNKEGFLEISHPQGNLFFDVERDIHSSYVLRSISRVVLKKPWQFIKRKLKRTYNGYLVMNKPKYLPGDTVKLKAYLVKKHKPLNIPLELTLQSEYGYDKNMLAELNPVSKGAYTYEFILGDSLEIDRYYELVLHNAHGRKAFTLQNVFYLEDYQLDEAVYQLSTDKDSYTLSDTVTLLITAKDANGLPLSDAVVDLTVETDEIFNFYEDEMYVDFLLWKHKQKLDPSGETKIIIPDSIFPNAEIKAKVKAKLSNSNYEAQEKSVLFNYDHTEKEIISVWEDKGKIRAILLKNGKEITGEGELVAFMNYDSLTSEEITFPYAGELNPLASDYIVLKGKAKEYFSMRNIPPMISHFKKRTQDSAIFELFNPLQLDIHYSVFKNKKKIASGVSKDLSLKYADDKKNDYSVSIQFVWAGSDRFNDYCICHDKEELKVDIDQPAQILPGQTVKIGIQVKDYLNKPVKNVNLTAASLNSQFGELKLPDIRFRQVARYKGKHINSFRERAISPYEKKTSLSKEWRDKLHLDTQVFYKLLYPAPEGFYYYHPQQLDQSQFAPFVFDKGNPVTVFMIKADGKLLYYKTRSYQRYSFPLEPGFHQIVIRTYNREITLDSVFIEKNKKLYISFDINNISEKIKSQAKSRKLSEEEIKTLDSTFVLLGYSNQETFYQQGNVIHLLKHWGNVVGPFYGDSIDIYRSNKEHYRIGTNPLIRYHISYSDDLELDSITAKVRREQFDKYKLEKIKSTWTWYHQNQYGDVAFTQKDIDKLYYSSHNYYSRAYYNPSSSGKGEGSFYLDYEKYLDSTIIYNNSDTLKLKKGDGIGYGFKPGKYFVRGYRNDSLILIFDKVEIKADKIFLKKIPSDIINYAGKDPDGYKAEPYKKEKSYHGRYAYSDKHSLEKLNRDLDLHLYDLSIFNLIPNAFSYKRKLNHTSIGISPKASLFHGDIASGMEEMHPGFGLSWTTHFRPRLAMRKEFSYNRISGNDLNAPAGSVIYNRGLNFRNDVFQYSASLLIDLIPNRSGRSVKRSTFNMYGIAGTGLLYSNPKGFVNSEWINLQKLKSEGKHYHKINFYIPAGAGMKFKLAKYFDLAADWTYNFTFTDYLDDVSIRGRKGNDAFSVLSLRLNYIVPGRVICPKFRAGKTLPCPTFYNDGDLVGVMGREGWTYSGLAYTELDNRSDSSFIFGPVLKTTGNFAVSYYSVAKVAAGREFRLGYSNNDVDLLKAGDQNLFGVKSEIEELMLIPGSGMVRKNFRDYGYWKPNLITDDSGRVSFEVTFPGNVTKWNSYVLAMTGKQSGTAFAETKAFKPLMATLHVPRFMVEGDVAYVNGKSLNYTSDTLNIRTSFLSGKDTLGKKERVITAYISERQKIETGKEDTLTITYALKIANGYTDGEERIIPVFRKGTEETKGIFVRMDKDTSFKLTFDTTHGKTTVFADNNTIDVLLKEIQSVKDYPYFCTEQAASKLNALLMEKNIRSQLGQKFDGEREIRMLIKKLSKGQKYDGTWGWWEDSPTDYHMTLHIVKILQKADTLGYNVPSYDKALRELKYFQGSAYKNYHLKLQYLNLLSDLKVDLNYKKMIDTLDKYQSQFTQLEKFQLMRLKQIHKLNYNIQDLLSQKKETFLGSVYLGEEGYSLFNNSIQNTLLAYDILKREGGQEKVLRDIRNYFMEQRKNGSWRNTFESAQILEMILPDVLKESKDQKAEVVINNTAIKSFPYKTELSTADISVSKKGAPVYFTTYQKFWNSHPERRDGDFKMETKFMEEGKRKDSLTAGKNVVLTTTVQVKKEGRYVMIEIPIPAGCTYDQKTFAPNPNEVHREYFKDKVTIFCEVLPEGIHEFTIILQPRFSGQYTMNPAKAELMYFPVFNGRDDMKRVNIKE